MIIINIEHAKIFKNDTKHKFIAKLNIKNINHSNY